MVYIPKGYYGDTTDRDREIYREHADGATISELCRKYDLSDKRIRSIIKAASATKIRR